VENIFHFADHFLLLRRAAVVPRCLYVLGAIYRVPVFYFMCARRAARVMVCFGGLLKG
jgi:hypothetical protein